jgi:hypothetical protein
LKKTRKTKKKIDVASARLRRIEEAKFNIATERVSAEKRLHNLKEKLPRILARRALKRATDGEISAIKRDIMDLETLLVDFSLTLQGLDELERPIRNGILDDHNAMSSVVVALKQAV